jgi:hypothetical protein
VRTAPEGRDSRLRAELRSSTTCVAERSEAIKMTSPSDGLTLIGYEV